MDNILLIGAFMLSWIGLWFILLCVATFGLLLPPNQAVIGSLSGATLGILAVLVYLLGRRD